MRCVMLNDDMLCGGEIHVSLFLEVSKRQTGAAD